MFFAEALIEMSQSSQPIGRTPQLKSRKPTHVVLLILCVVLTILMAGTGSAREHGPFPPDTIRTVASAHRGSISMCFMVGANGFRDGMYKLRIGFDITPQGTVRSVKVQEANAKLPQVERCVVKNIRKWRFPQPQNKAMVHVVYPISFQGYGL